MDHGFLGCVLGSGSLCFGRGSVESNIEVAFDFGTKITDPSADCCKLHSYGEYGLPSESLKAYKY